MRAFMEMTSHTKAIGNLTTAPEASATTAVAPPKILEWGPLPSTGVSKFVSLWLALYVLIPA